MPHSSLFQTLSSAPFSTDEIVDRITIVAQLLAALPEEPEGPALLY